MTRTRTLLIACVACGLSFAGFVSGRESAQQVFSGEKTTNYEFPMALGDFKTVLLDGQSYIYFFEGPDASIRKVTVPNGGRGIQWVEVIRRPGTPPRGRVPGSLP